MKEIPTLKILEGEILRLNNKNNKTENTVSNYQLWKLYSKILIPTSYYINSSWYSEIEMTDCTYHNMFHGEDKTVKLGCLLINTSIEGKKKRRGFIPPKVSLSLSF